MFSGNFTNLNYNPIQTYKRALGHLSTQDHSPAWTSFAAATDEESTPPYTDMTIYYMLIMTHTLCIVCMIVSSSLKKMKSMEILGEFVKNAVCSFIYIGVIIYCIYRNRLRKENTYGFHQDKLKDWVSYEIATFFAWQIASAFFIQVVYWSKFKSVW
jgi:hypothetical protein